MSNWFEEHPLYTIIGHTLAVALVTGAYFYFVFDTSKVDAARAQSDQYRAKVEALESEIAWVRADNQKYLSWMTETPNTIPYLEERINRLTEENAQLRETLSVRPVTPNMSSLYGKAAELSIGQTFVDPETMATLGLGRIDDDFTANLNLMLPTGSISVAAAKPGDTWRFSKGDRSFQLMLERVDWYTNKATVSITEIPQGE